VKKLVKNKKGVTLMEVIIGTLLFALVTITVATVLAPVMLTFKRANDIAEYNLLLDNIGNHITSDIAQASKVVPVIGGLTLTINSIEVTYTFPAGILLKNEKEVLSADYYDRKTISFSVDDTDSPNIIVTVTIIPSGRTDRSGASLSRDYAVRPLMISKSD